MLNKLVIIPVTVVIGILCNLLDMVRVLRFGKFIIHFGVSKGGSSFDIHICFSWPGEKNDSQKA